MCAPLLLLQTVRPTKRPQQQHQQQQQPGLNLRPIPVGTKPVPNPVQRERERDNTHTRFTEFRTAVERWRGGEGDGLRPPTNGAAGGDVFAAGAGQWALGTTDVIAISATASIKRDRNAAAAGCCCRSVLRASCRIGVSAWPHSLKVRNGNSSLALHSLSLSLLFFLLSFSLSPFVRVRSSALLGPSHCSSRLSFSFRRCFFCLFLFYRLRPRNRSKSDLIGLALEGDSPPRPPLPPPSLPVQIDEIQTKPQKANNSIGKTPKIGGAGGGGGGVGGGGGGGGKVSASALRRERDNHFRFLFRRPGAENRTSSPPPDLFITRPSFVFFCFHFPFFFPSLPVGFSIPPFTYQTPCLFLCSTTKIEAKISSNSSKRSWNVEVLAFHRNQRAHRASGSQSGVVAYRDNCPT